MEINLSFMIHGEQSEGLISPWAYDIRHIFNVKQKTNSVLNKSIPYLSHTYLRVISSLSETQTMLWLVGFVPFFIFQILNTQCTCPLQAEKYLLKKKQTQGSIKYSDKWFMVLLMGTKQSILCFWPGVFHVFYMMSCTAAGNILAVSHLQINVLW